MYAEYFISGRSSLIIFCDFTGKTRRSIYPFYEELRQMNSDLSRKPSPVSRLFAILHNLWISFGHTSSLKSEGWPGGVDYQNNVVAMYFKSKQQILLSEQTDLSEDTDASKQAENVGGANENTMPGSSTGSQGSQSGEGQGSQSGESQGSESGVKKSSKAATVSVIVMNVSIINNSEEYFVCFRVSSISFYAFRSAKNKNYFFISEW